MKQTVLELSKLDVIFMCIALVSLFANLYQFMLYWRDRRNFKEPIANALRGLFNDIKAKVNHTYGAQNLLFSRNNPHQEVATLRWDYAAFTQSVLTELQGFQETVVGILVTLDPSDREGKAAFRAADYGMNEDEKRLRQDRLDDFRRQQLAVDSATAAEAANDPTEEAADQPTEHGADGSTQQEAEGRTGQEVPDNQRLNRTANADG